MYREIKIKRIKRDGYKVIENGNKIIATKGNEIYKGSVASVHKRLYHY